MQKTVVITSGTTFTIPSDYGRTVKISCFGPGGNGGLSSSGGGGPVAGGGGGGGAYAEKNTNINWYAAGQVISIQIGTGGSGVDTWFDSASYTLAKAGQNGSNSVGGVPGTDGLGGAAAQCVGDIKYSGGNGATAGGGAAGPNGAGNPGQGATGGGSGDAGFGGAGGAQAANGQPGTEIDASHGSGGGGGGGTSAGAAAGNGGLYGAGGGGEGKPSSGAGSGQAGFIAFIYDTNGPTVAPDVTTGTASNWNGGANLAAGRYLCGYVQGAYRINAGIVQQPAPPWGVQFNDNDAQIDGRHGYYLTDGAGNTALGPGNTTGYLSQTAAETGNAGLTTFFDHSGGKPVGIYLLDGKYTDNVAGAPSSTFSLYGPVDATLTASSVSIDVGDSSTLTWGHTYGGSAADPVGGTSFSGSQSVSPTTTTTYTHKVNGSGGNTKSVSVTVVVNQPTPPTSITATGACGGSIAVSWSGATHVASFILERSPDNVAWSQVYAGTVASFTDTPPTAGATYYYRVKSVKGSATSGASAVQTGASILAAPTPSTPTVTAHGGRNVVSWTLPAGSYGTLTTKVYRSTSSGAETLLISGVAGSSYNDTGLTNGQIYYYTIAFANDCGTGSQSGEASGTPSVALDYSTPAPPASSFAASSAPASSFASSRSPGTAYAASTPPANTWS